MKNLFVKITGSIFILFLLFYATPLNAQTALSAGDIVFVGINSDGNDDFAFLLLKGISSGTTLYISDKGWNDASGFYTTAGDGIWQWSTSSDLAAGTIVHIKTTNNGIIESGSLAASPGTVSWIENNGTIISYSGDQVFLYQGTEASPTFIAGIHYNYEAGTTTTSNWDGSASSAQTSALPNQLTNGVNAIWVYGSGPTEYDNFRYNCSVTSGDAATLRAAITDLGKWNVDLTNTTAYTLNPFPCTFTVLTTEAPTITTSAAASIAATSATLGGNVSSDGGATVTARGVVYSITSTNSNPQISGAGVTQAANGSGTGTFSASIGSLIPGTNYSIQAYATNSIGTSYGGVETFTTMTPTITFTNGANSGLSFEQTNAVPPVSNWLCGQFSLVGDVTGATLNSVTVTLGGTYDSGDLESTPFQLYASNTNDFSGASTLGSSLADPGSGSDVTFSVLSDAIPASTRYYWVTADISASATGDDTMNSTVDSPGDISITAGDLSGSSSYGKLNAGTDASLPVDLSSFSAVCQGQSIILEWVTESETDNLGFILERTVDGESWTTVASYQTNDNLKGQGNTSSKTEYSFTDTDVELGASYQYRLSDVSTNGKMTTYESLSITLNALPEKTAMEKAYPNPFNPSTFISYHLAEDSDVQISVYDMLGRKVQTLFTGQQPAGSYHVYWHGKNEAGNISPTGTYLIRMQTMNMAQVQKVLLMK